MALIKDTQYIKIEYISGNAKQLTIVIHIYNNNSKESFIEGISYLFTPNLDGYNFIKQGYEYIKSLPEYTDAVDC